MQAVVFNDHGGPDVLEVVDLPVPVPGASEVRIRVEAVALNHLDIWVRQGLPGPPVPMPHLLGSEMAGTILEVGSGAAGTGLTGPGGEPALRGLYGDPIHVGQRVVLAPMTSCRKCEYCLKDLDSLCVEGYQIFGYQRQGGYAEEVAMPADVCIPLGPDDDPILWAAIPLTFMTAWRMLHTQAHLQSGESVLVHAAGSGVGTAAIQIAKQAGATVYTTASTPEKRKKGLELGADAAFDYSDPGFAESINELTGGRGVDVIFEHVGSEVWEQNLKSLARGGRLVTCGATTGGKVTFDLRYLFVKQVHLIGSYMGSRGELLKVVEGVRSGELRPVVDRVFPLTEAADAHRYLADRSQFGKVVLRP